MSKESPPNNPMSWFFNACILLLFGMIALSVVVDLLRCIWPWILCIALVGGGITAGFIACRIWRKPW